MTLPFENDTRRIIKKLAENNMKSEKRRNFMVMTAVALAAFLICFAGTMGVSIDQIQKNQITDTYEAAYVGVDGKEIEALRTVPEFARVGTYYMLGTEKSTQGFKASFIYGDDHVAYMFRNQMKLVEGQLPEEEKEILVSRNWLSRYAPDAGIGETVHLDTRSFPKEAVISGIMDTAGEEIAETYTFMISKAALEKWEGFDASMYVAYVHHREDTKLDADTLKNFYEQTGKTLGLPEPHFNVTYFRWAEEETALEILPMLGILAGIILIGGCIVIQSIFRISINDKIKSYGQLRTLGATAKQIRKIVKKEGRALGGRGILAGILCGAVCCLLLFYEGFHPLYYGMIILFTILICWLMVSLSIRKPMKIAAEVSPIEAVRLTVAQKKPGRNRKNHKRLNPFYLGWMNFARDRKKTISIALSLSIGGILLLCISTAMLAQDPERMSREYFPDGNYKLYLDSDWPEAEIMEAGNPLNEELKQEVLAVEGVTDVLVKRRAVHSTYKTEENTGSGMCEMLTEGNRAEVERVLDEGTIPVEGHGILLDRSALETYPEMGVGAVVELSFGKDSLPVTVSGIYHAESNMSSNGHGNLQLDRAMLYAPEELFEKLLPGIENFEYSWSIVSEPKQEKTVKAGLETIVNNHTDLGLDSFSDCIKGFEQNNLIYAGLKAVSWMIFLFGVVNLINTTLSNQIVRKQENGILRSVGLTRKQLYRMVVCEGLSYVVLTTAVILAAGLPISVILWRQLSIINYSGKILPYQFPFAEMGVFLLALVGMECILSLWTMSRQKKQTVIEQLRGGEM